MFHHFVHLGVSTRQFCDWVLLLSASKNYIDKGSFEALLDEFALRKAASVLPMLLLNTWVQRLLFSRLN